MAGSPNAVARERLVDGWSVCAIPLAAGSRRRKVSFYASSRTKYLTVGADLLAESGIAVGDFVTLEHSGRRYRIRKVEATDPVVRGHLVGSADTLAAKFSTGGTILYSEGVEPGIFDAQAYEGAIVFDAEARNG